MTIITRRAALGGLALLSGGAATFASPAPVSPPVDADLLRLRGELDAAEARFFAAVDAEEQAFQRWQAIRPQPDAILVAPRDYRLRMVDYGGLADPRGNMVLCDGVRPLRVAYPASIRVALGACDGRTATAKWLRRMLFRAEQFWREWEAADYDSGAVHAGNALRKAWWDLDRLSNAAFAVPATSLEGLAVMTRAAVLADLGKKTCNGLEGDPRFVTLAATVNAIAGRVA